MGTVFSYLVVNSNMPIIIQFNNKLTIKSWIRDNSHSVILRLPSCRETAWGKLAAPWPLPRM